MRSGWDALEAPPVLELVELIRLIIWPWATADDNFINNKASVKSLSSNAQCTFYIDWTPKSSTVMEDTVRYLRVTALASLSSSHDPRTP
jgi:hypothetical protein